MSLLFKNAKIISTENDCFKVLENAYLGVNGKFIDYIGTEKPAIEYSETVDMYNKLLMPGLVNGHTHTAMNLLKGIGSNLSLQDWLHLIWPIEDKMREQDLKTGMDMAILEMLAGGTVSFSDMYMAPWFTQQSVGQSGIKANMTRVVIGGDKDTDYLTYPNRLQSLAFHKDYDGAYEDRLHVDFCIHGEYTIADSVSLKWAEEIQKIGGRFHTHLSETKKEHMDCIERRGITPAAWFEKAGFFNLHSYAAHCVWVSEEDMQILKNKKVTVVHNPTSNMKLGSGFAQIPHMLKMGINVALGTDGSASNNNLNMFEEMHLASVMPNGYTCNPTLMTPSQVLKMATVNGALAQGRPDTGSLEVGKKADIIALNLDAPHMVPDNDTLALITYSAQAGDVCMTMVDGRVLYKDGQFLTMDREKIFYEFRKSHEYLSSNC